ncbi:MAG: hypothetical protein ACJ8J0_14285 [Longimicrobiaceae bacterium]
MKILFDVMGAQIQIQQQPPNNRLTTWFGSLADLGYDYAISSFTPLAPQLAGVDVWVSLTRQQTNAGSIPPGTCFGYSPQDLGALQTFVNGGGSILMFSNHSWPLGQGPVWPINEIQLAAALGIQLVFAEFAPGGKPVPTGCTSPKPSSLATLTMSPNLDAPPELIDGVSTVEAWDSGGIVPGNGTVIIPLPGDCSDQSGLGYLPGDCAFAVLYTFGSGKVIVAGHSGIVGNYGTCSPSPGQIESADNLTFLNNCITYLGGG